MVGTASRRTRADSTEVRVDHGVVIVRGERVPGAACGSRPGSASSSKWLKRKPRHQRAPRPSLHDAARRRSPRAATPSAGQLSALPGVPTGSKLLPEPAPMQKTRWRALCPTPTPSLSAGNHAGAVGATSKQPSSARPGEPPTRARGAQLGAPLPPYAQNPGKAARLLRSPWPTCASFAGRRARFGSWRRGARRNQRAADTAREYLVFFPAGLRKAEVERWSVP